MCVAPSHQPIGSLNYCLFAFLFYKIAERYLLLDSTILNVRSYNEGKRTFFWGHKY